MQKDAGVDWTGRSNTLRYPVLNKIIHREYQIECRVQREPNRLLGQVDDNEVAGGEMRKHTAFVQRIFPSSSLRNFAS